MEDGDGLRRRALRQVDELVPTFVADVGHLVDHAEAYIEYVQNKRIVHVTEYEAPRAPRACFRTRMPVLCKACWPYLHTHTGVLTRGHACRPACMPSGRPAQQSPAQVRRERSQCPRALIVIRLSQTHPRLWKIYPSLSV